MGRPPLPLKTWGVIRTHQVGDKVWRAIANYKDYDGVTRPVERVGSSPSKAENNLREALRDRSRKSSDGEIKPERLLGLVECVVLRVVDHDRRVCR
jgi:hypothetical protein